MAARRFFRTPQVTRDRLAPPPLGGARAAVGPACTDDRLAAHDWSGLSYRTHRSKRACAVLGQAEEVGYEPASGLLRSDTPGQLWAPVCQTLTSAVGQVSSRQAR